MLKSQQSTVIPKITRYPWKKSYHFQPNPWSKCWISPPLVWNHLANLIWFCSKQQLSYDNCDSYLMIAVIAFPNSWDSFFRIDVTADPAALALLIFHIWLKPKPTKVTIFFLPKCFPFFSTLSPATFTRNSKNTLKLNILFLAKS